MSNHQGTIRTENQIITISVQLIKYFQINICQQKLLFLHTPSDNVNLTIFSPSSFHLGSFVQYSKQRHNHQISLHPSTLSNQILFCNSTIAIVTFGPLGLQDAQVPLDVPASVLSDFRLITNLLQTYDLTLDLKLFPSPHSFAL